MNFISQSFGNLTSGGKIYIFFQLFYLACGIFFLYVQWQILLELRSRNNPYTNKNEDNDFTYSSDLENTNRDRRH
jgi:hypothetical protein